jgi:MFS family permease
VDKGTSLDSNKASQGPAPQAQAFALVSVVVLLAGIVLALIQCKVPSILPELTALFNLDARTASWLMSTFTIVGIVVAVPLGSLARRFGPKRILLVSGILAFGGSLLGAATLEGSVFIASRALEGIALTAVTICGPAILRSCIAPERIGAALGIWTMWFGVGSTAAGIVTPLVFAEHGYQIIWVVYAVLALIAVILVQVLIKVPIKVPSGKKVGEPGKRRQSAGAVLAGADKPRYRELLRPNIAVFMVAFAVYCLLVFSLVSYVPTVLQLKGYEPISAGFISTIPLIVSVVSSPVLGMIYDKLHHLKLLLCISFVVLGVCVSLMFVITGTPLILVAVISGLFGNSGASILLVGYLSLLPRQELMEQAMGIFILVQGVGQFLGSFLVQALLGPDLTRFGLCAAVLLASAAIGTVCVLICQYRQPKKIGGQVGD